MSELKQRLYKYELAKIGFPDAEYLPCSDKIKLKPGDDRLPDINNAGDIRYSPAYSHLALHTISPMVDMINEVTAAWENSRPAPFEGVSHFNILSEYNNTVLAARDDAEYGRGLYFVTWKYNEGRTEFYGGHYTEDYVGAKESFALRSGLMREEKVMTQEQAADIKAAIDFFAANSDDYDLDKRLNKISEDLCHVYPGIFYVNEGKEQDKPANDKASKTIKPDKQPTLQDKLDRAKQTVKDAEAQKDKSENKRYGRNGQVVD
jgi:hypothetical protein